MNHHHMKRRVRQSLWACLACATALTWAACSEEITSPENNTSNNDGLRVGFVVSDVQNDAQAAPNATTRTSVVPFTEDANAARMAALGLNSGDLTTGVLPTVSSDGSQVVIVESTVAGVNPVEQNAEATRANIITTATLSDFSTMGYRGATEAGISTTPWFYNMQTSKTGELKDPVMWEWSNRFAKFYAVYPQAVASYGKLVLAPESNTGTPYVDFEVEQNVLNQKDLMTATTNTVEYAEQGKAPTTKLRFRHALTAINFKVGSKLPWNKTITSIVINNALYKGRYTLPTKDNGDGAKWELNDARTNFTLSGLKLSTSQAENSILTGNGDDNYTFYMMPQELTDKGVTIKITYSDRTTTEATLKGSWLPGTTKTYAISGKKNPDFEYTISATDPVEIAWDGTTTSSTDGYSITSYRTSQANNRQTAVGWQVIGYEESTDGGETWGEISTTKPSWLSKLSLESGAGSTSAQRGTPTVVSGKIDYKANYNSALTNATAKGSSAAPFDLSDPNGTGKIQNTANCYVISAPGNYKIPMVYGNAIKNGAPNPAAYYNGNKMVSAESAEGKDYYPAYFVNYSGMDESAKITAPEITVEARSSAALIWADSRNLVTNVKLSTNRDYIEFAIAKATITNGNAVIALKDPKGVVMWSWHIWVAGEEALNPIPAKSLDGTVYNFSTLPLGAVYDTWEGTEYTQPRKVRVTVQQTEGNGTPLKAQFIITQGAYFNKKIVTTFYQWGRKDPMPYTDAVIPSTGFNKWNTHPAWQPGNDPDPDSKNVYTVQRGIQNPGRMYYQTGGWGNQPNNSSARGYLPFNLWSANDLTGKVFSGIPMVKTVYDPSPAGFRVPEGNAFTWIFPNNNFKDVKTSTLNTIVGSWLNGYTFKTGVGDHTLYIPATGYRNLYNGDVGEVGGGAFIRVAESFRDNLDRAYQFRVYPTDVDLSPYGNREIGEMVFPVAE